MTLAEQLRERLETASRSRPPEVSRTLTDGIAGVHESGIADRARTVGDRAPSFTLPDALGRTVTLEVLLERGPLIISFYRGGWCPYCNLELRAYQDLLPQLSEAGTALVAISPESPDESLSTSERLELGFSVLTDQDNRVAAAFGIVHPVPSDVEAVYRGNGIDLQARTGQAQEATSLPLPATFLVDEDGMIRYAFVSPDYTLRAEPSDVLDAARALTPRASRRGRG